jgi:hypothetical protein
VRVRADAWDDSGTGRRGTASIRFRIQAADDPDIAAQRDRAILLPGRLTFRAKTWKPT